MSKIKSLIFFIFISQFNIEASKFSIMSKYGKKEKLGIGERFYAVFFRTAVCSSPSED